MEKEAQALAYMQEKARKHQIPFQATFELTARCNLRCKMCYVRAEANDRERQAQEMSAEYWLKLADQSREMGVVMLTLTGGEPMLHRDFREIYTGLSRMGFVISVNTNATLINKEWIDFFRETPPHRINVTLYGGTEETYKRVSGNGQAFERALAGMDMMLEAGLNAVIRTTLIPENADDMVLIHDIAEKRGMGVRYNTYSFPPSRRDDTSEPPQSRLSSERAAMLQLEAEYLQRGTEEMEKKAKTIRAWTLMQEAGYVRSDPSRNLNCTAGRSAFWFTWDGKLLPCGVIGDVCEDVSKQTLSGAWNKLKEKCEKILCPEECVDCKYRKFCSGCAAMHHIEEKIPGSLNNYICNFNKIYLKNLIERKGLR